MNSEPCAGDCQYCESGVSQSSGCHPEHMRHIHFADNVTPHAPMQLVYSVQLLAIVFPLMIPLMMKKAWGLAHPFELAHRFFPT